MKIKNLLVIPIIALAVSTLVPVTVNAEFFYDEFSVSTDVNNCSFDDFASVSVYQGPNVSVVDVIVTINSVYSPSYISSITGYDASSTYSNLLGLWNSDKNGVVYNPYECYIVSFCYDYDSYGNEKFIYNEITEYNGWNRSYWTTNFSELYAGDSFGFEIILFDEVDSTNVKIFGKDYTVYADDYTDTYVPEFTPTQISIDSSDFVGTTITTQPTTSTTTINFTKKPPLTISPTPYITTSTIVPITTTTTSTYIETTTETTTTTAITTTKKSTTKNTTLSSTTEKITTTAPIQTLNTESDNPKDGFGFFKFAGCSILAAIGIIAKKFL